MVDENRNKHFGFIDKSCRFHAQQSVVLEEKDRGVLKGITENVKPIVKKNDDVRLKKVLQYFKL